MKILAALGLAALGLLIAPPASAVTSCPKAPVGSAAGVCYENEGTSESATDVQGALANRPAPISEPSNCLTRSGVTNQSCYEADSNRHFICEVGPCPTNPWEVYGGAGGGGSPIDATYWVSSADSVLTAEQVVNAALIESAFGATLATDNELTNGTYLLSVDSITTADKEASSTTTNRIAVRDDDNTTGPEGCAAGVAGEYSILDGIEGSAGKDHFVGCDGTAEKGLLFQRQGTISHLSGEGQAAYVDFPSIDDVPGVADGAGADPTPFPASQAGLLFGDCVVGTPFTYSVDWIHRLSSFNQDCNGIHLNPNFYSIAHQYEYSFDGGARSGNALIESIWSVTPVSRLVTFSAGTGTITQADNVTFTGGEICRSHTTVTMGASAQVRFTCVDGNPPDAADTITAGCGGCTGTVSTAVLDTSFRPEFHFWRERDNVAVHQWLTGPEDGGGNQQIGLSAQGTNRTVYVGWGGPTTPQALAHKISITSLASSNFPDVDELGNIKIDPDGAATTGGQFLLHDGTAARVLQPTETRCFQWSDLDATDDDVNLPIVDRVPITITAMGCRNDTTAAPTTAATLTLETLAGTAITLASTLTCVGNATAISWATTVDADAILASGAGVRFDTTNTPNPATDEHTICLSYLYTRQ